MREFCFAWFAIKYVFFWQDICILLPPAKLSTLEPVKTTYGTHPTPQEITVPLAKVIGAVPGENSTPIIAITSACLAPEADTRLALPLARDA
jgi:hypothetical protein